MDTISIVREENEAVGPCLSFRINGRRLSEIFAAQGGADRDLQLSRAWRDREEYVFDEVPNSPTRRYMVLTCAWGLCGFHSTRTDVTRSATTVQWANFGTWMYGPLEHFEIAPMTFEAKEYDAVME